MGSLVRVEGPETMNDGTVLKRRATHTHLHTAARRPILNGFKTEMLFSRSLMEKEQQFMDEVRRRLMTSMAPKNVRLHPRIWSRNFECLKIIAYF